MGWFGRWIGNWAGKWFGTVQQQAGQYTTARRFGRILKQSDILFADSLFPSVVSSGGVVLARASSDDYVRFRVPDTQCPPLPEPDQPLDSGVSDEAEPNRWGIVAGSPNTSNKWLIRAQRPGADRIQCSYTMFSGAFIVRFSVSLVGYGTPFTAACAHGVGLELKVDENNLIRVGAGWVRWYDYPPPYLYALLLARRLGGVEQNRTVQIGNGDLVVELERTDVDLVRTRFSADGGSTWSSYFDIATITSAVWLSVCGFSNYPVTPDVWNSQDTSSSLDGYADARVTSISTVSGAPSSVQVATPVVDMGVSTQAQVKRYPENLGTLEWRASNTPFAPGDSSPAWDSPTGAYRYWQARVTWTDPNILLERIELLTDAQRLMLFRRFRDYWTIWDTTQGKSITADDGEKAVFGSGVQTRTADGWEHGSDEERVTTVR